MATDGFLGGEVSVDTSCEDMAPPRRGMARKRAEEGGGVWELLAPEAVKAPFQLSELL